LKNLYSVSGNADYMLISLNPYGYVVYNLNTGGFEEIDVSIQADFYYLGPNKYCYKQNGVLTDADSGLVMTNAELNNYQQILSIKQSYEQISMNRPLVTAMFSSYNEDCPMNHSNVTYGYTIERHNQSGEVLSIYYHVHNGWKYNSENLKSYNYAWFADALYIEQIWEWI
jgi:hypothetical protein